MIPKNRCYSCKMPVEFAGIDYRERETIITRTYSNGKVKESYVFDRFCLHCGSLIFGVSKPINRGVEE